jgi:hypothetical protein
VISQDEDGGFDICSVAMSTKHDRGPLQMITGERLAQLQNVEAAAVRYVSNPTPENLAHLGGVVRRKTQPKEKA